MADVGVQIRCQRCGEQMELRDPAPGQPWPPQQFWVCNRCGRHFWTSYASAPGSKPAAPAPPSKPPAAPAAAGEAPPPAPKADPAPPAT